MHQKLVSPTAKNKKKGKKKKDVNMPFNVSASHCKKGSAAFFCVAMVAFVLFLLLFLLFDHHGFSNVDNDEVSVMEGDSVTLYTGVQTNQQKDIRWYFHDTRIAHITGDLSFICIDVQCKNSEERFRDRLKLDHQTGSLTITNTRNTDAGEYKLKIISSSSISEKIFNVTINVLNGRPTETEQNQISVKEGRPVTLDPGVVKHLNDLMTWYFNEILIAAMTGYRGKICEDQQCNWRFRDRLELDYDTGSLIIHDIRTTDSGLYKLLINSTVTVKQFGVTVYLCHSSNAVAGISAAAVVLLFGAAVVVVI